MDGAVSYLHALHVLSADIKDEIDSRQELFSCFIVCHSLDDTFIHVKAGLNKAFSVTGDRCS